MELGLADSISANGSLSALEAAIDFLDPIVSNSAASLRAFKEMAIAQRLHTTPTLPLLEAKLFVSLWGEKDNVDALKARRSSKI